MIDINLLEHEQMREEARQYNNPNQGGQNSYQNNQFAAKKSPGYSSMERTVNFPKGANFGASPMIMSPLATSGAA